MHPSLNYYQTVHVAKVATDVARITTISAALTAISDNVIGKRYAIIVHPGTYTEKITMKPYVDLIAAGGREETVISFAATVADEPTLTAENAIIKGFTIIADSTAFRSRCVQAATTGFEMEDCILTISAPAGTETCLNATASCDIRDCVIDSGGGSAVGALFTTAGQTYNVYHTTFDGATDAIQVTITPTLNLVSCAVADNLNQDGGTIVVQSGQLEAVALGTAACTFTAEGVRFTAAFATADAFAHTITCHGCSFSGQNFNNAATGATTVTLRGCNGIATLTNAGIGGTVTLYETGVETLTTTQGTVVAWGGRINACGGSTGTSFVWWKHADRLQVLPNMLISNALTASVLDDVVVLAKGTYAESNLTAKNGVDIVGEGSDISIIETTANANPILNVGTGVTCNIRGVRISNLGTGTTIAITAGAGAAVLRLQDCDVRGNAAASIVTLTTAGIEVGAPTLTVTNSKFSTGATAIAAIGAIVATVTVDKSVFATCTLVFSTTGANHAFALDDCDFGTGGVTLTANVPVVTLTKCEDIGTFTHSTASTVTLNQCRLSGGYTTGAVAAIVAATGTVFAAVTHGGTGAFTMNNCVAGAVANNNIAAMTLQTCTIGNLTQAAAAGTITASNCVMGDISTGANGTIRLQGSAQFTDIAANAGVLTWKVDPNHIKVVAGTANMKMFDALALAAAGDVIEVYPGTYAEANLNLKASVNIVGTDREQCLVGMDSAANPIFNAGLTCTVSNLTIFNSNAGNTAVTVTANILTLHNCYLYGFAAGNAIAMTAGTLTAFDTLVGVGDINLSTAPCTLSMYRCRLTTDPIVTAGAFAHAMTFEHCEFGGMAISSAATLATTLTMRDCTAVGALTHAGTGAWAIDNSTCGALTNSFTATVTVVNSTLGAVTQAATAGTINITNCTMGAISTGATGVMQLNGACNFTDIAANAGTLTWKFDPNTIMVVAGTANMKIADALTLAAVGDVIKIGPGTYLESSLTLKAGVNLFGTDPEQCLIATGDVANPILNAGVTCTISHIGIGNTNAGAPAIRVTANILTLRRCYVYGTGLGDALAMTAGTLIAYDTRFGVGDIDLSTAICTLTLYRCQVTTDPIDTTGFLAHVLTLEQCDLGAQNIASAATGATTLALRGCTNVSTVSNAGTEAFTIRDSDVATITVTNAAGSAVIRGGNVNACGGSTGSVTWKTVAQQYQVIAGMKVQHAITAAAADTPAPAATAPYTVIIHPGIYAEVIACSAYVHLKGVERKAVTIQQTDANVIVLASNIQIESLTVRITTPTVQRYLVGDAGAACTSVLLQDVEFAYTTPAAIANWGLRLTSGSWVIMRQCWAAWSGGNGAEILLSQTNVSADIKADGCVFSNSNSAATLVSITGGAVALMNCRFDGAATSLAASAGIIRLTNSTYNTVTRTGTGSIVDLSLYSALASFRVVARRWELTAIANQNIAIRTAVGGAVTPGGTGQARLRINDNALDAAGVESAADAAGALGSTFTPSRNTRYVMSFSINALRATTTAFWGLRAVLGAAVPGAAEHHAGFTWNGANFIASSSNGAGVGQTTVLANPSTGAHHILEIILYAGGVTFRVDGLAVASHSTVAGIPTAVLYFQEYEISTGAGGATTSDITLREGFLQECLA